MYAAAMTTPDPMVAAYLAGESIPRIARRLGMTEAEVTRVVYGHVPRPRGLQIAGIRVIVSLGLGFLVATLTYLLGAVPGLNVAVFVVTAIVSYPILMAMVTPEPPR